MSNTTLSETALNTLNHAVETCRYNDAATTDPTHRPLTSFLELKDAKLVRRVGRYFRPTAAGIRTYIETVNIVADAEPVARFAASQRKFAKRVAREYAKPGLSRGWTISV